MKDKLVKAQNEIETTLRKLEQEVGMYIREVEVRHTPSSSGHDYVACVNIIGVVR